MAVCQTYRLHQAIVSVPSEETDSQIPTTVPPGAVVTITDSLLDGFPTVDVVWGNKSLTLFTLELRERATLIDLLSESNEPFRHYRNSN
jgi:hypothetical protein